MPVMQAYQQLLLEGYVDGRRGSGTFVSHTLPDTLLSPAETFDTGDELRTTRLSTVESLPDVALSSPGHSLASSAFRLGQPALDAFPHRIWQSLLARCYRHCWQALFDYQNPAGYWPLREAIASYLAVARGVRCTLEQVIVTTGSQHGLDLIARTLPHVGDAV
jgi:GntR family transcriptional regulator/MocR family aminotransferase